MTGLLLDSTAYADGCEGFDCADGKALVVHPQHALMPTETRLEKLRRDREVHTYKQIWTKDPHDGPYRKAAAKAYDPLLYLPDGTERQMELGYERVEKGPTTNFVGNHMTQGAIDLVQAELERPVAAPAPLQVLPETVQPISGPQLLECKPVEQRVLATATVMPPQKLSWWDDGETVCIQLDMDSCRQQLVHASQGRVAPEYIGGGRRTYDGSGSSNSALVLECKLTERSLHLRLSFEQAEMNSVAEEVVKAVAPSVQLRLGPLCHPIEPAACSVVAVAPLTLLPAPKVVQVGELAAASGGKAKAAAELAHVSGPSAEAAAAPEEGATPASSANKRRPDNGGCTTLHLVAAPGSAGLLLRLRKAHPAVEWGSLHGTLAVAQPQQQAQPDLAALRRAVRQQRQASRAGAPACLPAPNCQAAPATPAAAPGSEGAGVSSSGGSSPSREDLLAAAHSSVRVGQYQAAIDSCTVLLHRWAPHLQQAVGPALEGLAGAAATAVELQEDLVEALTLRAECHGQMGQLKQAIADYSAAIELATSSGEAERVDPAINLLPATLNRLLLARAAALEQLEQYGLALDDLRLLAASQQPTVDSQVTLGIQRVSRSLCEAERVRERQRSEGGVGSAQPPSVPRQSQYFSQPKGLRI